MAGFDFGNAAGGSSTIDGLNVATGYRYYDDFTKAATLESTTYTNGAGAAIAVNNTVADSDHPGNMRILTGTTNSGIGTIYQNQAIYFGNGFTWKSNIYIADLSTASEE